MASTISATQALNLPAKPLREVLAASRDLAAISDQLSKVPVTIGIDDLVPLVMAGERVRDNTDRRNYALEWTVYCGSLGRDLRGCGLHQAADIFASCVVAIQKANDSSALKDPHRDFRQEVAARALRGLGDLATVDRVTEISVANLVHGFDVIKSFVNAPEANYDIPGYTSHKTTAGGAVSHHLKNYLIVQMYTLAEALGRIRFDREWDKQSGSSI